MSASINAINWFEIPASDFDRAVGFYSQLLDKKIETMDLYGFRMGLFPNENGVGGAVVEGEGYIPSHLGSVVYLQVGDDLQPTLDRVEASGGKILQDKTDLGENGFMAFFEDSEGNRIGLHSMN